MRVVRQVLGRALRVELALSDRLIREAGYEGEILFRSPYCKKLLLLPLYLSRTGRPDIIWDVEPDSYVDIAGDPDRIADYVLTHAGPGSIILLHPWYESGQADRDAVPKIIAGLQARGFRFVTVSELLARS